MPRLNHGTLLENPVVLEVTRVLALDPENTFEFAASFSMPPLTQCWHSSDAEYEDNPKFNMQVMTKLMNGEFVVGPPTSYSAILKTCLLNAPNLPWVPYSKQEAASEGAVIRYPFSGPNGALLVAMLRRIFEMSTRMWLNDPCLRINAMPQPSRYYGLLATDSAATCPQTSKYARSLLAEQNSMSNFDSFCETNFPQSISAMADWSRTCDVRLGFLDPDTYYVGNAQADEPRVNSNNHVQWLNTLSHDSTYTASIMFFSNRNALARPALKQQFHNDAVTDYPLSVVFCHGNHMVGVKLRGYGENDRQQIIAHVQNSWAEWSALALRDVAGLNCDIYGVPHVVPVQAE